MIISNNNNKYIIYNTHTLYINRLLGASWLWVAFCTIDPKEVEKALLPQIACKSLWTSYWTAFLAAEGHFLNGLRAAWKGCRRGERPAL